jgi:uncharacterized membrane protein
MDDRVERRRRTRQLKRLETLTDVVFALVIFRAFVLITKPGEAGWRWDSIGPFLSDNITTFAVILIGIVIVIVYWLQNNTLFGNLERTDTRHTALSILQIFFLLIFLFSIRLGVELGTSVASRAFESVTAALVGITAISAWSYATKGRRLLLPEVKDEDVRQISVRIMAEPITAIITIPMAFVGQVVWELSWLAYPPIVFFLRRRKAAPRST